MHSTVGGGGWASFPGQHLPGVEISGKVSIFDLQMALPHISLPSLAFYCGEVLPSGAGSRKRATDDKIRISFEGDRRAPKYVLKLTMQLYRRKKSVNHTQLPIVVCKMEKLSWNTVYICTHCIHILAHLAPICMLSWCLLIFFCIGAQSEVN